MDIKKENILLYDEVANKLKRRIFTAVTDGGEARLPSFRMLSKEMGVSGTTIRQSVKILMDKGIVSSKERSGIFISDEFRQGQKTLAVVYGVISEANIRSPWHGRLLKEINRCIVERGWLVRNYTLHHGTDERDERVMDQLIADAKNGKFVGMVSLSELRHMKDGFQDLLDKLEIKYLTNDYFDETNAVVPDYFSLGRIGAEYLYKQGVRKMGILGVNNTRNDPLRWDQTGFMSVVNAYGDIEVKPEWNQLIIPTIGNGYDAFEKLWSLDEKPDGLVVSDDVMFLGVAMAMNKLGVNCPKDIKLIVNGLEDEFEKCGVDTPRICFSPERNASLMVNQIISMIRENMMIAPMLNMSPMVFSNGEFQMGNKKKLKQMVSSSI
jgi:DNA-binding LacI/PurR family transcriptional regulator